MARLQLGEVEDIVDRRQQGLARAGGLVDEASADLAQVRLPQGQAGETDHTGERRAQLVAHIGQEIALDRRGGFGRGTRCA